MIIPINSFKTNGNILCFPIHVFDNKRVFSTRKAKHLIHLSIDNQCIQHEQILLKCKAYLLQEKFIKQTPILQTPEVKVSS